MKTKICSNLTLKRTFDSKKEFKDYIQSVSSFIKFNQNSKKIKYANIPAVVDIESTSFIDDELQKGATMYAFTLGFNGHSYLGRAYEELLELLHYIAETLKLYSDKRLIIWVHNLQYEFQFFNHWFNWDKLFALSRRDPLYAITDFGIEFRCSLHLSGYSLAKVGEGLQKYKVEKKVGDLDYSLKRHAKTPLTDKEKDYILYDGLVVMAYIQEQIESHHNNICYIPLTKTGEVRKYCRKNCLYGGVSSHKKPVRNYHRYRSIMEGLSIRSVEEYKQLKRAFSGGFTHANPFWSRRLVKNVTSYDFTSSYPYVMVSEKFPMSRGELYHIKDVEDLKKQLKMYCCIMDVTFFGLESKVLYDNYLSESKCIILGRSDTQNGRVVYADELTTSITDVDFEIIEKFYKWKKISIRRFRRYRKDYLPKDFIMSILELYKRKTVLKGVEGKEAEYLSSKELLNSCYGMCVTDICRPQIIFDNHEWRLEETIDYEKDLNHYNNAKNRFLAYQWGIFVTAYARRNLFTGIYEFKNDYIYSDTDSVKVINIENHLTYIRKYNEIVKEKLLKVSKLYDIDFSYFEPETIKGEKKLIGVWDLEDKFIYFKTLGSKRYLVTTEKGLSLTVSGLNKKIAVPYLLETYKTVENVFDNFDDELYIPKGKTGKKIHTYIDEPREGIMIDYLGNKGEYHEYSSVYMEEGDYSLSMSENYVKYLYLLHGKEFN